jgi:hypothetical protein
MSFTYPIKGNIINATPSNFEAKMMSQACFAVNERQEALGLTQTAFDYTSGTKTKPTTSDFNTSEIVELTSANIVKIRNAVESMVEGENFLRTSTPWALYDDMAEVFSDTGYSGWLTSVAAEEKSNALKWKQLQDIFGVLENLYYVTIGTNNTIHWRSSPASRSDQQDSWDDALAASSTTLGTTSTSVFWQVQFATPATSYISRIISKVVINDIDLTSLSGTINNTRYNFAILNDMTSQDFACDNGSGGNAFTVSAGTAPTEDLFILISGADSFTIGSSSNSYTSRVTTTVPTTIPAGLDPTLFPDRLGVDLEQIEFSYTPVFTYG